MTSSPHCDIAIIGMSCRFPGHCNSPQAFWELLESGGDAISTTDVRWGENVAMETSKHGGFLDDVDCFDAAFFSVLPKEAMKMDPQHRILLELHWEALESACIPADTIRGSDTGVYTGIAWNDYEKLCHVKPVEPNKMVEHHDLYLTTGTAHGMAPGAISFFLDLRGPSMAIDTASSSSLVSLHLACQGLQRDDCSLAFASGVCLNLSPDIATNFTQSRMLAARSRVFDADAGGYARSEGAAVVLLKRYDDARRDGNRVLAVVKGIATNQNGRGSSGITAPRMAAQCDVYLRALARAGLQPRDVQYIEAHGTGTPVGDPVELESVAKVYGEQQNHSNSDSKIWIGSAKTNIGHTEMAAGLAGVIKTVLSLQHEFIPPHIHFSILNRRSPPLNEIGLGIAVKGIAWPRGLCHRIAAVSSFGLFGSNAHVVLGDPPAGHFHLDGLGTVREQVHSYAILTISAKTKASLDALIGRYRQYFKKHAAILQTGLMVDALYTSNVGRTHFQQHRAAWVLNVGDPDAWLSALPTAESFQGSSSKGKPPPAVHFVLCGGEIQMGPKGSLHTLAQSLYKSAHHSTFRTLVQQCAHLAGVHPENFIERPLDTMKGKTLLHSFILEYCLARTLMYYNIIPERCTCYSTGEYVGAVLAQVIALEDAIKLVQVLEEAAANGTRVRQFAAIWVHSSAIDLAQCMQDGDNSLTAVHMSSKEFPIIMVFGQHQQIQRLVAKLKPGQYHALPGFCMPTSKACEFAEMAKRINYNSPSFQLNVGRHASTTQEIGPSFWFDTRLTGGRCTLRSQGKVRFTEPGPPGKHISPRPLDQNSLSSITLLFGLQPESMMGIQQNDQNCLAFTDERSFYNNIARLYAAGHTIKWETIYKDSTHPPALIDIPTYAFDKKRYWYPAIPLVRQLRPAALPETTRTNKDKTHTHDVALNITEAHIVKLATDSRTSWAPYEEEYHELFRELCIMRVLRAFVILGVPEQLRAAGYTGINLSTLAATVGVIDKHRALFEYLVKLLSQNGYLELSTTHCPSGETEAVDVQCGPKPWPTEVESNARADTIKTKLDAMNKDGGGHDGRAILLELATKCGHHLNLIMEGIVNPLSYLFPPTSSPDFQFNVGRFYAEDPDLIEANKIMKAVIEGMSLETGVEGGNPASAHVLEVGAGTGGTTASLLAAFEARSLAFDMVFTDISRAFFSEARKRLRTGSNVQYRVLDIEADPIDQGYDAKSFDIVIGSNVVHATKTVRHTLQNLQRLLRPGGYLLLIEFVHPMAALDIVFGCLSGWWAFKGNDADRPDHALLASNKWIQILEESGFDQCYCIGFPAAVVIGRLQGEHFVEQGRLKISSTTPSLVPKESPTESEGVINARTMVLLSLVKVTGWELGEIDEEKDFTDLGMDSIRMRQLQATLVHHLGAERHPMTETLLAKRNVRELVQYIERLMAART